MHRSGFSIMEIVVAFGIVAVAILGLIGVFMSGVQLSARSRNLTGATQLGQQTMERIKFNISKMGFAYLPAGTYSYDGKIPTPAAGAAPFQFPPAPYPTTTVSNQNYILVVSGTELSPTLREVQVEVLYGPTSRVKFTTRFHS
jgi:Tfp pilus assembly protein PilV